MEAKNVERPKEWTREDQEVEEHRKTIIALCDKYHITDEDRKQLYGSLGTIITIKLKRMIFIGRAAKHVLGDVLTGKKGG